MRSETHLLRQSILAAAVFLTADAPVTYEIVALDEATKDKFAANVPMPEAGQINRLWDALGEKVVKTLGEKVRGGRRGGKTTAYKLAAAIQAARGLTGKV